MSSSHKAATSKNSSKSKQAAAAAGLPNDFIDVDAEGDVEEEDQLMMNNQPTSSSAAATLGYGTKRVKRDYQVLTQTDLQREVDDLAGECSSMLALTCPQCKLLLSRYNWDKQVLFERYFEAEDNERFLRQAGICLDGEAGQKKGTCQICFERGMLLGLTCAHLFCADCWNQYLGQAVIAEGRVHVLCPAERCTVAVDEDFARARLTLGGSKTLEQFAHIQLNSFVEGHRLIKWCPAPHCELASKAQMNESQRIRCTCGHNYCFKCSETWHAPIGCALLKVWLKQCNDDSETFNWISAYTKDCPKCKTAIEKNGGCNHMSCRTTSCKHEFCWVCMGDWKSHNGNYSCNRFTEEAKSKEQQAESSRAALKRYLHYYDRFRNHDNSLKLEHKLYQQVGTKVSQFQAANFCYADTMFLRRAVDTLCECRRTLSYTYAFAFYLKQDNMQTRIFEIGRASCRERVSR